MVLGTGPFFNSFPVFFSTFFIHFLCNNVFFLSCTAFFLNDRNSFFIIQKKFPFRFISCFVHRARPLFSVRKFDVKKIFRFQLIINFFLLGAKFCLIYLNNVRSLNMTVVVIISYHFVPSFVRLGENSVLNNCRARFFIFFANEQ